ncbi:hypothetical protein Lal_00045466 [Lupinus albus]|nr:hypothetical protein Lal_00045466 [Lupinus albus]
MPFVFLRVSLNAMNFEFEFKNKVQANFLGFGLFALGILEASETRNVARLYIICIEERIKFYISAPVFYYRPVDSSERDQTAPATAISTNVLCKKRSPTVVDIKLDPV